MERMLDDEELRKEMCSKRIEPFDEFEKTNNIFDIIDKLIEQQSVWSQDKRVKINSKSASKSFIGLISGE